MFGAFGRAGLDIDQAQFAFLQPSLPGTIYQYNRVGGKYLTAPVGDYNRCSSDEILFVTSGYKYDVC